MPNRRSPKNLKLIVSRAAQLVLGMALSQSCSRKRRGRRGFHASLIASKGVPLSFANCSAKDPAGAWIVRLQFQKARLPMLVTPAGIVTLVRPLRPRNASFPISDTPSGMTTAPPLPLY